ncbi:MAG: EAL domain-containing protein, partial [Rhodobacteraceae bacterium]|nr:EAL domain-containing protein [Paracoccaceae bacterium]
VRSIIGLSHSLNIGVIAEGVETEDDLRKLRMERCCEIQGYLLGKPESNEMLLRRVQETAVQARIAS